MSKLFKSSRKSGKSDSDILVELVAAGEPGELFTFERLIKAIEADTDRKISRAGVTSVVNSAKKRILTTCDRVLISVRNTGYRIGEAKEHMAVSALHKDKGKRQIGRAWDTLEHVRRNELSREELAKHSEQMVKTGELLVVLEQHESRLSKIEQVLIEARKQGRL